MIISLLCDAAVYNVFVILLTIQIGIFEFETVNKNVDDKVGTINIPIVRKNGADGQITVEWKASEGTAKEGDNYALTPAPVRFADKEVYYKL